MSKIYLSKHLTLQEMTKSQTASRWGIDNTAPDWAIENMKALAEHIFEPVRTHYNVPIIPSSGFRSEELNRTIRGSRTSQHRLGQAIDFEVPGVENPEVCEWIVENLDFDQLILEHYTKGYPNSGWIHCSYRKDGHNRKQVLTKQKGGGYRKGLVY